MGTDLFDGVRFERVGTPQALETCLASLPAGVRYGIVCDLVERGKALRLDGPGQRVFCLASDEDEIIAITWGPTSTLFEATILLSAIKTLNGPIDEDTAVQLYRRATFPADLSTEPRKPSAAAPRHFVTALQRAWERLRWRARLGVQTSPT
jgi:hypothetical protein